MAKHRRVVWGSRGLGCFAIVGTMYEREFSKRPPWKEEGGFTACSVLCSHRANPSDRSVSPPNLQHPTNPLLSLSSANVIVSKNRRNRSRSPPFERIYRASDECEERRECIVAALDSSNDTKEPGRVGYRRLANRANLPFLYIHIYIYIYRSSNE